MQSPDDWTEMMGRVELEDPSKESTDSVAEQKRKDYEAPTEVAEKLRNAWNARALGTKEFRRKKKAQKQAQKSRATNRRKAGGRSRKTHRAS